MSKVKQNLYMSTQAWVRVREIENGLFINEQGQRFVIFKLRPINFNLKSDGEKEAIIQSFAELLRSNENKITFYSRGHSTNLDKYLKRLSDFYKKEGNEACRDVILDEINFAQEHAARRSVSFSYYVVVEYLGLERRSKSDKRRFRDELVTISENIKSRLENLGVLVDLEPVLQAKDQEICDLLYSIYNRKKFEDGIKARSIKGSLADLESISAEDLEEGRENFEKESARNTIALFTLIVLALIMGLSISYFGLMASGLFGGKEKPSEKGDDLYIQDEIEDFEEDEIVIDEEEKETKAPLEVEKLEDEFELELIEDEEDEEESKPKSTDVGDLMKEVSEEEKESEEPLESGIDPKDQEETTKAPTTAATTNPPPVYVPPVQTAPTVYYPPVEPSYYEPDPGLDDPGEGDFFFEDE